MSKRQEIRSRRQKAKQRSRLLVVGLVALVAIGIVVLLVLPGLMPQKAINLIQVTPRPSGVPKDKTSIGNPAATVTIDAWEDFQCSGCEYYTKNVEPLIMTNYVDTGKVLYTFHFYPFIDQNSLTQESHQSANAAICAAAQGRFWDYHDILFTNWQGENLGGFSDPRLIAMAQSIKLDMTAFNQCFRANTYKTQIEQDFKAGQDKGVQSTPSIFVNGKLVVSKSNPNAIPSYDEFAAALDAPLAGH
jgi:protein-disulfide isomerase